MGPFQGPGTHHWMSREYSLDMETRVTDKNQHAWSRWGRTNCHKEKWRVIRNVHPILILNTVANSFHKKNQGRHLERRTRVMDARHLIMDGRSGHLDKGTREQRPRGKQPEHLWLPRGEFSQPKRKWKSLSHVQLFATLCLWGTSVHGISQARILEWGAISAFRGSSWSQGWTLVSYVSCLGRQVLYH